MESCRTYLPEGCVWTRPSGGMSLWITLPAPLTADALLGVVERFFDKMIGLALITRVLGPNQIERFFETHFMHFMVSLVQQFARADERSGKLERPNLSGATPE